MEYAIVSWRSEGCYDWAHPGRKEAQLCVEACIAGERVCASETVEIGGKWDRSCEDPWDTLDAIEGYSKALLISTGRKDLLERIAKIRAARALLEIAFAEAKAKYFQENAAAAYAKARSWADEANALREAS